MAGLDYHAEFRLFGYRELDGGQLLGPKPIGTAHTLSRARESSLAFLWFEREKWSCVSIVGKDGLELARFSRFPPSRQPNYSGDMKDKSVRATRHSNGARLAVAASGSMKRNKTTSHEEL